MNTAIDFRHIALQGLPLKGEVVIDAHMHIDVFHNFLMPRTSPESLFASAHRIGIQRLYGSSLLAIRTDAAAGNQHALALQKAHPDIFSPYVVFKPNYPEESRSTIDLAREHGIGQFKIHDDGNDLPYDHRSYDPLYEYAEGNGALILAHTYGRKHVAPMMNVAARFPRLKILLGHAGITDEEVYIEASAKHENIYLETCSSLAWYGLLERLVGIAGAERILFGSDMPFMSPDQQIGRILFARISDDDRRKILGLNALSLFG